MKKFDGYLIASDWDGTLCTEGRITDENRDAIRYFEENGGYFTIASGRQTVHLSKYTDIVCPNTYAICVNGALIRDIQTAKTLYDSYCDKQILPLVRRILSLGAYTSVTLFLEGENGGTSFRAEQFEDAFAPYANQRIRKAVFVAPDEKTNLDAKSTLLGFLPSHYIAARSWPFGVEIFEKRNGKGEGLLRLKRHLGVHTAIAVGDYENDIDMLLRADIGYAVANATPAVKEVADRLTSAVSARSLADIITDIEGGRCAPAAGK